MNYLSIPVLIGFCLSSLSSTAQLRVPGTSIFRDDMQKVVADFPHDFAAIRGRQIDRTPQSVEYSSFVAPAGTTESSIIQYSSGGKAVYTWQTVLLRTENFAEAAKKYKWAFAELRGMNVRYVVDQYTLEGRYDTPQESRTFAISDLNLAHPPQQLSKLRVRIQLQYEENEWKVSLVVFEKERKDEEVAGTD